MSDEFLNKLIKTKQISHQLQNLVALARSVISDTDPQNDLSTLRVRSKSNEIIVVTGECKLVRVC
uniref:Roadblock/LAMTOR2 domain-containing protein n=1 Tax=Astatotilapia calliptera TaxID=8154 RepID=A0AAX7SDS4_ASTCA